MSTVPSPPRPLVSPRVADVGLAGLVLIGAAVPIRNGQPPGRVLVCAVACTVVVLLRRRLPLTALALTCALSWLCAALDVFSPGVVLAAGVATYTVATLRSRRATLVLTATAAVVVTGAGLLVMDWGLQVPAVIAAAGALGDATRSRREYLQAMTERALRAEATRESEARRRVAEDRLAIARDLHDAVAHQIAVINLHAAVATTALHERPDDAEQSLTTIRTAARTVLHEIGTLLASLRDPTAPTTPGLGLADLAAVLEPFRSGGLDVTVRILGTPRPVLPAADAAVVQVVREALTNAHKHGTEHRAHVLVDHGDGDGDLTVTVTNPTDPGRSAGPAGHGRQGMRERIAAVGGTLDDGPVPPGSWRVRATVPVDASPEETP